MVSRDGAQVRKERIQTITQFVLGQLFNNGGKISLSKIIAMLEYETGLRHEKIVEYLRIGADVERFVVDRENNLIKSMDEG